MGNWKTFYEIIGWSVRKLKAGTTVDADWMVADYDEMVVTRSGKRMLIGDVSGELVTQGPPTYDPEGEPTDVWTLTEDVIALTTTGYVGDSKDALAAGGIQAEVLNVSFEDTFGSYWKELAEIAWPLVDASSNDEACFGTLWTFGCGWSESTWMGPAEFDTEIELVGKIDFAALGAWYRKAAA